MKHGKEFLWVLLPFAIGLSGFSFIPLPILSQIVIVPFWIWVGNRFAGLNMSKIQSLAFGNSVWGICFLIFIWQYLLESDPHRLKVLEVISLSYISPFYVMTRTLPPIGYFSSFEPTPALIVHTLVAYLLMFIIFTLGYIWGKFRRRTASVG